AVFLPFAADVSDDGQCGRIAGPVSFFNRLGGLAGPLVLSLLVTCAGSSRVPGLAVRFGRGLHEPATTGAAQGGGGGGVTAGLSVVALMSVDTVAAVFLPFAADVSDDGQCGRIAGPVSFFNRLGGLAGPLVLSLPVTPAPRKRSSASQSLPMSVHSGQNRRANGSGRRILTSNSNGIST
ncbi:hypothetical protein ABT279_39880, partial [Amycolatopsis sp. NPDC000673]